MVSTYEVSINLQGKIIKKQFSKESEADDFANYIQDYINIRNREREENKLDKNFKALQEQYKKDTLEVKESYIGDIEERINDYHIKSMN